MVLGRSMYPTPADDFINFDIVLNEDSNVQISLTTALGQRLLQENIGVRRGQYTTALNVQNLL